MLVAEVVDMCAAQGSDPARSTEDVADGHGRVVVVGVDGSEASSRALAWAAQEACLRNAILRVVHAWNLPALSAAAYLPPSAFEDAPGETQAALDTQIAEVLGPVPDVKWEREVLQGPAAQVILEAAEDAELVVVGSRGRGGFAGLLLGSVSNQVAHHAHCPVTIVHS